MWKSLCLTRQVTGRESNPTGVMHVLLILLHALCCFTESLVLGSWAPDPWSWAVAEVIELFLFGLGFSKSLQMFLLSQHVTLYMLLSWKWGCAELDLDLAFKEGLWHRGDTRSVQVNSTHTCLNAKRPQTWLGFPGFVFNRQRLDGDRERSQGTLFPPGYFKSHVKINCKHLSCERKKGFCNY